MALTIHDVFATADCLDHPLQIDPALLEGAVTLEAKGGCYCTPWNENGDTCGSWCDSGSYAIARLADGRFLAVEESSDTSGHGCRCSGSAAIFLTEIEARMLGVGKESRSR